MAICVVSTKVSTAKEVSDKFKKSTSLGSSVAALDSVHAAKIVATFASFDTNSDGTIDTNEFVTVMRGLNSDFFTDERIRTLFSAADVNSDGRVSYSEFVYWLFDEEARDVARVREELGLRRVIPVLDGLQVWLDATCSGSVDTSDDGFVTRWRDLSDGDNDAIPMETEISPMVTPAFSGSVNGIRAVSFPHMSGLRATHGCTCKTVALAAQIDSAMKSGSPESGGIMMLFSQFQNQDFSIRVFGGGFRRGGSADRNDFQYGTSEKMWLNTSAGRDNIEPRWNGFPSGPLILVAVKYDGRADDDNFIYQLSSAYADRGFRGSLGEVAVYNRELSDSETEDLYRYLNEKWILKTQFKVVKEAAIVSGGSLEPVCEPCVAPAAPNDKRARRACRFRGGCHDKSTAHRSRFSHPGDDDYQKTTCKYGASCYLSDKKHLDEFTHPTDDGDRRPCPFSVGCYQKNPAHLDKFAHPGDPDYFKVVARQGGKPAFLTMMECFKYCEFEDKGLINGKEKIGDLFIHLDMPMTDDELQTAWEALEDGKALCYFPEFVEWANFRGINLPLGIDDSASSGEEGNLECGFVGCSCKVFKLDRRHKGKVAFCTCKHKKGLHVLATSAADVPNPAYWTSTDLDAVGSRWVRCDSMVSHAQKLVDASYKKTWTRDRGKGNVVPDGYIVQFVFRNENPRLWRKYKMKKNLLKNEVGDKDVDRFETRTSIDWTDTDDIDAISPELNEWYLWHGTSHQGAEAICRIDFKVKLAGTTTGTLYGKGTYFAESITKADEYAKEGDANPEHDLPAGLHCALLCRIIGGRVLYNDEVEPAEGGMQLQESCLYGDYDSVVGDREKIRGTFREFVIFSGDQAYPEYIIYFTRRYD